MPSLHLVCRRAHDWTERIKYRVVTSKGRRSTCRVPVLQKAIQCNSKPTPPLGPQLAATCWRHAG
ncbi:hypothetical protein B0H19DRAFT_1141530 [Mycena capillaripes]|nr:hypothetical protein B0H19DRAFT_1141530 [Mycena capillaripes]